MNVEPTQPKDTEILAAYTGCWVEEEEEEGKVMLMSFRGSLFDFASTSWTLESPSNNSEVGRDSS